MDACLLQDEIIKNPEHIRTVLEHLGHSGIRDRGDYFQAFNIGGDNPTGCSVRKDDLIWNNWSHGRHGSIFTMVQDEESCDFRDALYKVANWIGYKDTGFRRHNPFGGFYTELLEYVEDASEQALTPYDESLLPNPVGLSKKFFDDGVALDVQEKWGITFDHKSNGIVIPWRDTCGQLVGAKWRNNDSFCSMDKRWNMYLKFPVSQVVYGWNEHYSSIVQKKECIIFEAEKSVLQLESFDIKGNYSQIGLAIGGHNISKTQVKKIRAMFPNKIIVAFDAGLPEEEIRYNAKKFIDANGIHNTKVGYIFEPTGRLLQGKDSPTDRGVDRFKAICRNCVKYIN